MTLTEQSTLTRNQKKVFGPKLYSEGGTQYRIYAEVRFDDECKNGHNTFSITGRIDRKNWRGVWEDDAGGCIHVQIAKYFPDLARFIKWHLTSTDGPMHYAANVIHLAGDRDCWGLRKGQDDPRSIRTAIQFGNNPIKHTFRHGQAFMKFLESAAPALNADGPSFDFEVIGLDHDERATYGTKYTFGGFAARWHECPFDTEAEALDFLYALQHCAPKFVKTVTAWGKGKERQLDAARLAAIWPEATDEQLSADPSELKAALEARLPALLAEFRADVEELGFTW